MRTFFASFAFFAVLMLAGCDSLRGPQGQPGLPGPVGPQGVPGSQGPAGESGVGLLTQVRCTTVISVGTVSALLIHSVYKFADDSVMTTCEVAGSGLQATGVGFYKEGQSGALDSGCLVTADVDASSFGYWEFTYRSGSASTATYRDAPSANNGRSWSVPCTTY